MSARTRWISPRSSSVPLVRLDDPRNRVDVEGARGSAAAEDDARARRARPDPLRLGRELPGDPSAREELAVGAARRAVARRRASSQSGSRPLRGRSSRHGSSRVAPIAAEVGRSAGRRPCPGGQTRPPANFDAPSGLRLGVPFPAPRDRFPAGSRRRSAASRTRVEPPTSPRPLRHDDDHDQHLPPAPTPADFGGVHDPSRFHDGCGVAFVGRLDGRPIHETIDRGLVALDRLEHRGATGADALTGDGAGIMIGLPHDFFRSRAAEIDGRPAELPPAGRLGVAMCFLRREAGGSEATQAADLRARRRGRAHADRLARRPRRRVLVRRAGPRRRARDPPALHRRRRGRRRRDGLRALALRDPPPRRGGAGAARLVPEHVLPDDRLQGDADGAAAAAVLPRPARHDDGAARSRSSTPASRPTPRRAGSSPSRCG